MCYHLFHSWFIFHWPCCTPCCPVQCLFCFYSMIVGYFHTVYVCFSSVLNSIILKLLKKYIFQVYIRFVRTLKQIYISLRVIITDNNICVILYCMKLCCNLKRYLLLFQFVHHFSIVWSILTKYIWVGAAWQADVHLEYNRSSVNRSGRVIFYRCTVCCVSAFHW